MLSSYLGGVRRDPSDMLVPSAFDSNSAAAVSAVMLTATSVTYVVLPSVAGISINPFAVPQPAWPAVVGLAFLSTFISIQAFYAGARRIGGANAALVSSVEPLCTISLATLLLGEHLSLVQIAGGGLLVVGVLLAQADAGWHRLASNFATSLHGRRGW
jgi:drug/metabolite transporter (DMT)-like permease